MSLLPKSIHRCRRYPTKFNSGRDIPLFGEAVRNFTEMGIAIAVDDMGAGHSRLEKIANLNPKFLKFDIELVRDIDASYVRQEQGQGYLLGRPEPGMGKKDSKSELRLVDKPSFAK